MRIALFSDIHGNAIALDVVLAAIARQGGVDEYWVLGDLVAVGPQPIQVLERLTARSLYSSLELAAGYSTMSG